MFQKAVEPPHRRLFLATVGGVALVAAAASAFVIARPTPPAPPPKVEVVSSPIVVPISIPQPAPPAPPPPPPSAPPEPAPIVARAASPHLDAACVDRSADSTDEETPCGWDDGFPAISDDGKTVIAKLVPDDGNRGFPGLYIQFFDATTGTLARSVKILDPDEYDSEAPEKHRAKIAKRVAVVQRTIDAGHFRALIVPANEASAKSKFYVETRKGAVRLVDTARAIAIWQHTYEGSSPARHDDPDAMCYSVDTVDVRLWFDEPTRTIVSTVGYSFGPSCMCGGEVKTYVHRL